MHANPVYSLAIFFEGSKGIEGGGGSEIFSTTKGGGGGGLLKN